MILGIIFYHLNNKHYNNIIYSKSCKMSCRILCFNLYLSIYSKPVLNVIILIHFNNNNFKIIFDKRIILTNADRINVRILFNTSNIKVCL